MKNIIILILGLALFVSISSCITESAEEEASQEELEKVDELRKSDEERMDSMRRALGID